MKLENIQMEILIYINFGWQFCKNDIKDKIIEIIYIFYL